MKTNKQCVDCGRIETRKILKEEGAFIRFDLKEFSPERTIYYCQDCNSSYYLEE